MAMTKAAGVTAPAASVCRGERMAEVLAPAGKARVRRLFASRGPVPASPEADSEASPRQWLSEVSPPDPLAQWASSFGDLSSCWKACREPEWLLWLAARTCDSAGQRKPVVLCAAEFASVAQRSLRDADPRVVRATSLVRVWAESGADDLDLLAAECDALDAARESEQVADRAAERALRLFRSAPRRRPGSSGMNRAFGAWQGWHEAERGRCLALSAALAARAAALPDDGTVTTAEWAGCVSESADFALRAMSTRRATGGRPGWLVMRRCLRLARGRLTCP
jgi:hypothetical protein